MSKVSIIVPVYNGAAVLHRCVDSLLAQDYKEIEVILADDGSRDDSYRIICEYAEKDPRVVPVHKENGGVSSTRNLALSMASGEYIQFVDVDDFLPFDSTKMMVRAMEEEDCDMVIGDFYRVVDDKMSKKGSIRKGGVISIQEYADKMLLSPADFYYGVLWNKLYKKEIISAHGLHMDENISLSEDAIFNLQYLIHVRKVSVLKTPVYYYVLTQGSLVGQNLNLPSLIKMKSSVIGYYNDFYRQIFDQDEYETRKPVIYSFLVSVGTDALTVPILDDVKKLSQEQGDPLLETQRVAYELQFERLSGMVFEKFLNSVAQMNSLELNDAKLLYYLYKKKEKCSMEELQTACDISNASAVLSLAKLVAASRVRIADLKIFESDKVFYEYISSDLDDQFDKAEEDYRSLVYDGLSNEDIAAYARIRKLIYANMEKTIIKE
ncbi:MAG: glycosyltransferase family 2 protein [Erysipelotrichaceae bacterium]|nr:glycosyltransferase family 2 protein [Erysipelotrichaceae bacterium]